MTPHPSAGQQALIEAMQLEQARIYGRLTHDHQQHLNEHAQRAAQAVEEEATVVHLEVARRKRGAA